MTCAEFQELAHALAVGVLDPDERAACEAHLAASLDHAEHQRCLVVAAEAEDAACLLAEALPPRPPRPETWSRIEAQLGLSASPTASGAGPVAVGALPAMSALSPPPGQSGRLWQSLAWGVALAASVGCVVLWRDREQWRGQAASGLALQQALDRKVQQLSTTAATAQVTHQACLSDLQRLRSASEMRREAVAMLEQPGTTVLRMKTQEAMMPYRAQAILNLDARKGMVVASGLPRMTGKDFELWIIRGEHKQPAGLLRGDAEGHAFLHLDEKLLAAGPAFELAVTLEPEGGMPHPTGTVVLHGRM